MTTFDLSPLFRTSVGFDRLASMLASASRPEQGNSYPPYNIAAVDENQYQVTMAVAGFAEDDIEITSEQNVLSVSGKRDDESADDVKYLHRGIATRSFERRFNLADHVRVTRAEMENGLLHIYLEREIPEAMKPRKIEVQSARRLLDVEQQEEKAA